MNQHDGTYHNHGGVSHECRTGVHEHTDEDGHHCVRQDIDVDERVAHEDGSQYRENGNKGIGHHDFARLHQIVSSIEAEVDGEADDDDGDVENLSQECKLILRVVLMQPLVLLDERIHGAINSVCHNLASSHNLLTFLYDTACQGDARHQVVDAGLASLLVVNQVGRDIVIEVTLLENRPLQC